MPNEVNTQDSLCFLVCGDVGVGKSTLIGQFTDRFHEDVRDREGSISDDSRTFGTMPDVINEASFVDLLQTPFERWRLGDPSCCDFATPARSFVALETSGCEQHLQHVAAAAPSTLAALILVDVCAGLVTQTYRDSYIARLMGIHDIILCINKMDLVDYDETSYREIDAAYRAFMEKLGDARIRSVPISARHGENICVQAARIPWHQGKTLLQLLEEVAPATDIESDAFRFAIRSVDQPRAGTTACAGIPVRGSIAIDTPLTVQPAGKRSRVQRIVTSDGEVHCAQPGQAAILTLEDTMELDPGDVLCHVEHPMIATDQVQAHVIWTTPEEMIPGRRYLAKFGARTVGAWVTDLKYKLDVITLEHIATKTLEQNDIAVCNFSFDHRIACDSHAECAATGTFTLIDRATAETVGVGMVDFSLRRATNIVRQTLAVDRTARAEAMGQRPSVVWFTGLSGAGKSTIANLVEEKLHRLGRRAFMLDGDNIRHGINRDLGFTDADRVENVRRIAEIARLFTDAGLIALVSVISPFRSERDMARALMEPGEFFEVHVDAPLAVCEARDPKGLYARARKGEIANFTGIDSPYEPPLSPEMKIDTDEIDPETAAEKIIGLLEDRLP